MASAFGHAYVAFALGKTFQAKKGRFWLLITGVICAILPDADVISFSLGISYESFWGHRGFTHSLAFAGILALFTTYIFERNTFNINYLKIFLYLFFCTASHALLDAMTSGGLGVAFFAPFDNTRYFLPWRPIKVSPIGASNFFGEWGKRVLFNEAIWIGIPCSIYILLTYFIKIWSSK